MLKFPWGLLFVLPLAIAGCASERLGAAMHGPLVEVYLNADANAFPAPGSKPTSGFQFVACEDGRAIRASSFREGDWQFTVGRLTPASLATLRQRITASRIRALQKECELVAMDLGTANIAIWQATKRQFARCTWPPLGHEGALLSAAITSAEFQNNTFAGQSQTASELCN